MRSLDIAVTASQDSRVSTARQTSTIVQPHPVKTTVPALTARAVLTASAYLVSKVRLAKSILMTAPLMHAITAAPALMAWKHSLVTAPMVSTGTGVRTISMNV